MYVPASLLSWNHIHPVLVHFSTALVPASLTSDALGKYFRRDSLTAAAWWMLLYGAVATPLTVFAGWMWAADLPASVSDNLPGLMIHKWLGLFLSISFGAMAMWRKSISPSAAKPGTTYLLFGALIVGLLMFQGFLGGQMTIG